MHKFLFIVSLLTLFYRCIIRYDAAAAAADDDDDDGDVHIIAYTALML